MPTPRKERAPRTYSPSRLPEGHTFPMTVSETGETVTIVNKYYRQLAPNYVLEDASGKLWHPGPTLGTLVPAPEDLQAPE